MLPLSFLLELFCLFFFSFYLPPFSLCPSDLTVTILWNFPPVLILKLYRNEASNTSTKGIDKNGALDWELEGLTLPIACLEWVVHLVWVVGLSFPTVGLLYPVISMSQDPSFISSKVIWSVGCPLPSLPLLWFRLSWPLAGYRRSKEKASAYILHTLIRNYYQKDLRWTCQFSVNFQWTTFAIRMCSKLLCDW